MITGTLGGLDLQPFTVPFIENIIEGANDNIALDGTMYTDFTYVKRGFTLNWAMLHEDDYDDLRAVYDSQFITASYPNFTCSYYSITNSPVRMYINDRDVRKNGCYILGVEVRLVQKNAIISDNDYLTNESGDPILV